MTNFYEKLEELNKQYYELENDRRFKLGKALTVYCENLYKLEIRKIFKNLRDKFATSIIKRRYMEKNHLPHNRDTVLVNFMQPRIAVYTCVIGKYDTVQIPLVEFDNVDYYLITDKPQDYQYLVGIYKIIKIPSELLENGAILANRYVKFHPNEFFKAYDYAIYIDGNIKVISDIRTFINECSKKVGIAMHTHRERSCIYQEAQVCKLLKRGNKKKINAQMQKYKLEGFPENFGMNEASVIVSNLHNENAIKILHEWWKEFLNSESYRDQISWPYVVWKNKLQISDIGCLGENIYKNYKLRIVKHN